MAKKSNTLLYVGLGAAALFLYMRSKGAKLPFTSAGEEGEGEAEEGGTAKRGRVEVGPTEALSESEYYGQPSASPISRLRQKVQATAEDIESIRETGEGLFSRGSEEAGPIDQAMAPGRRRKTLRERLAEARAKRLARRKKRKAARGLKIKKRRMKRRRIRLPRRRRRLGEMDVI